MILIKSLADCQKIENEAHRRIAEEITSNLLKSYNDEKDQMKEDRDALGLYKSTPESEFEHITEIPENGSYSIYIENSKDDITKAVPHLSDEGQGLLCIADAFNQGELQEGWCWEDVTYHKEAELYEVVIIMNDEMGVGYLVPNDEHINSRLKAQIERMLEGDADS